MPQELFYDKRIEVNSSTTSQQRCRLVHCHAATEWPVFTDGVETIDHGNDSRSNWNLLTFQPVWISATVPLFMMMSHNWYNRIRKVDSAEDLRTNHSVDLHLFKFSGR